MNRILIFRKRLIIFSLFLILFTCGCKKKTYTVTFKDSEGTILKVCEVPYDEAPTFEGVPEKKSDDLYDYKFYSWDKKLSATNEDTTYNAIFVSSIKEDEEEIIYNPDTTVDELLGDSNNSILDNSKTSDSYFVTFLDDDNKTILQKTKFKYGETPYFKSGSPNSKIIGDYIYLFSGWSKTFSPVKGEQTYVAMYNREKLSFSNTSQTSNNSSSQSSQNQGNYVSTNTDKELEYNVKLIAYDMSNKQEGGGTFSGSGTYKANSRAYIIATPNKGMHFVKWSDGETSSTRSLVVNSNVEYTAYFEKDNATANNSFRVIVLSNNSLGGDVRISPKKSDSMYEEGTSVTISAIPKPGFKFGGWKDNNNVSFGSDSDLTKTFKVTQDVIYTAIFDKETAAQKEDEKDKDSVTINASISDSSAGYIQINGESTTTLSVKKGSDVSLKAILYDPSSTSFVGWSSVRNSNMCFSNQLNVTLNSISDDTNVTAYVKKIENDPSKPKKEDDPIPEIETVNVLLSSNPDNACTFKVNGSTDIPNSYVVGDSYIFLFEQTKEQKDKYEFVYWSIGSDTYEKNPIGYNPKKNLSNKITAVFKIKETEDKPVDPEEPIEEDPIEEPEKDPEDPTYDVDIANIKIGNFVTFNDNKQEYLVLDLFKDDSKNILKVIPTNSSSKTKYYSSYISKDSISSTISNTNIIKACSDYANNLSDTKLKEHLHPIKVNILDYENSSEDFTFNVHQSSISNLSSPSPITALSLSCYPLGLDEFDKLYSYSGYNGIYCAEDLKNFITLMTGSNDNSIWLKDLLSSGSQSISKAIYVGKDGVADSTLSNDYTLLPVLAVEIDDKLKIDVVSEKSLTRTKLYKVNFTLSNPSYGSIEIINKHFNNYFVENEEIKVSYKSKDDKLYKFVEWNDGVTEPNRTIKATGNATYIAIVDLASYNFSNSFEIIPFIMSTGEQYINTAYTPNANTKIVLKYEPVIEESNNAGAVCGVKEGNKTFDLYISNSKVDNANKTKYILDSNAENLTSKQFDSDYKQLTIQPKSLILKGLTDEESSSYTIDSENTFSGTNLPLYLFASNVDGTVTALSKIKLYSCQIYDGDTLVRNFIPVKYFDPDTKTTLYGLFDIIDSVFYPSSSSKVFEGPKDTDLLFSKYTKLTYLQNNGLSYVDTGTKASNDIGIFAKIMPLSYTNANYIGSVSDNLLIASTLDTSKENYSSLVAKYKHGSASYTNEYYSTNNTKPLSIYSIGYNFLSSKKFYSINNSDSSYVENIDNQKSISTSTKNIYIGKANGDDYNVGPARYYNVIISDKNNIIHNYYPVKDSEGNYGFLDLVNQEFKDLTNSSFTTPKEITDGLTDISDVKILTRIIGEGTQYVDTGVKFTSTTGIRLSYIPLEFYNSYYMGTVDNTGKGFALEGNLSKDDSSHPNQSSALMINASSSPNNYYTDQEYAIETGKPNPIISDVRFLSEDKFACYYTLSKKTYSSNIDEKDIDFSDLDNITIGNVELSKNGPGIFYYAAISDKQVVTHFYLPAQKGDDIGFYDVVDYKFFKSEEGNFINGTFKDDTKCQITITADEPLNLTRKLNNSADSIDKNVDTINCGFLSVVDCEIDALSIGSDDKVYTLDKWSDNNPNYDRYRKFIVYSPSSKTTYKAIKKEAPFSTITVNIVDIDKNAISNECYTLTYFSTLLNKNITDGKFTVSDKVIITATLDDSYKETYRWGNKSNLSFEAEVTIDSNASNNIFTYTLYPSHPVFEVTIVDSDNNVLNSDDFDIKYYSVKYFSPLIRIPIINKEYLPNNKGVWFDIDDTIAIYVKPKDTTKYMSISNDYTYFVDFYKVKDYVNSISVVFNTYNSEYSNVNFVSSQSDNFTEFQSIRNNSAHHKKNGVADETTDETAASKKLQLEPATVETLKKGDIIRFEGLPNSVIIEYPLYPNNDWDELRKWTHISNLYEVISVKGHDIELMDLSCVDSMMLSFAEVKDLNDLSYFKDLHKKDYGDDYEFQIYNYYTYAKAVYTGELHKHYHRIQKDTFNYRCYNYWGYADAYFRISEYLLGAYYKNMPSKLRNAIIEQNRDLYIYNDTDNLAMKAAPLLSKTIQNQPVYLLSVRDILKFIGYDYTDYQSEKSIASSMTTEQKKKLFDMFGMSNKIIDYSAFRYFSFCYNFFVWDYLSENPKIENNKITKSQHDNRMSRDGWFSVILERNYEAHAGSSDGSHWMNMISDYLRTAVIKTDCTRADLDFCFIRPCFTISADKLNINFSKLTDASINYIHTNNDTDQMTYDPGTK